ncbi:hypothetical protein LAZ40_01140 [Cereibacter sphaeroides]|uniref:hypothetical protein n=1 Tax=Cereibacter sphaeroides TaxID=1063 RepID=UPI001F4827AA|nr:hypothetical protein [Cereibacter sphaeroides]MCE6957671.1 hypothetical protein [Cereibacter sphaeroides]MCE6971409.1 hypothetical protein [Cereibacter sphaeroides]
MARLSTLDEILDEEDEFGLLDVTARPAPAVTPLEELEAGVVTELNDFYERQGRLPDPESCDIAEMRLGILAGRLDGRSAAVLAADRHDLLARRPFRG